MRRSLAMSMCWLLLVAGCGSVPSPHASLPAAATLSAAAADGSLDDVVQPLPSVDYAHSTHGPLLLVHGHDGNSNDWSFWAPRLQADGWAPKPFTFATDDWNIPDMAAQVGMEVEALCRESGQSQIDVLAHSIGGLATRYYIKYLGGDKRIRHLVMLATPNHGIYATTFMPDLDIRQFMKADNGFLKGLNNPDATYGSVIYTGIWSTDDYTQWLPYGSCRLNGAFMYRTHGLTHSGMLFAGRLQPVIEAGLLRRPDEKPGLEQTI